MAETRNPHSINSTIMTRSSPNAESCQGKSFRTLEDLDKSTNLKKSLKRKLQKNVSSEDVIRAKVRPNYFVAVQVSDHGIHNKIKALQEHMIQQDNRLEEITIDPSTLHITLMVMHIKDNEAHSRALTALSRVHEKFKETFCRDPVTLKFSGLDHFKNRVLFAKVIENEALDQLRTLAESVETHLGQENILSTDTRGFNPHLTIAKLRYWSRDIKKINPSLYKDFINEEFGSQTIKGIQLLSMSDPKDEKGYYTGDELLFSL